MSRNPVNTKRRSVTVEGCANTVGVINIANRQTIEMIVRSMASANRSRLKKRGCIFPDGFLLRGFSES